MDLTATASNKEGTKNSAKSTEQKVVIKKASNIHKNEAPKLSFCARVTTSGTREYEAFRILLTFVLCQFIGSMFYFVCALKYTSFPRVMGTLVSVVVQFVNCAMIVFPFFRILTFLAIPNLMTGRLRALLLVMIFTWSIQISAMNVTSNIKATADGIVCVQERVRVLAEELKESADKNLRQVPVQKIQRYLQRSTESFVKIRDMLRSLDDSLSRMMAWQRSLILKIRALLEDCSVHAQAPYRACVASLTHLHSKCLDSAHQIVCAPIHFLKHLCYVSKILELQCEWPKMLKSQMEEGVDYFVKESKKKAIDKAKDTVFYDIYVKGKGAKKSYETLEVSLNHSFTAEQRVDVRAKEFRAELRNEVGYIERFFRLIIFVSDLVFLVVMVLPFIYLGRRFAFYSRCPSPLICSRCGVVVGSDPLLPMYDKAFLYMRKFKRKDDANNYFITRELDELNTQQMKANLPTIFPLSKEEKKVYIYWTNWRIISGERDSLVFSLSLAVLGIVVPVVFVLSDIFTYSVLSRGYEFFHSNTTQLSKPNVYTLKVSGEGFMSQLLSNLLNTFEPLNRDSSDREQMWHDCFVEPNPPDYQLFKLMIFMFIFCLLLCFVQVYTKRAQHRIAAFYFPHRKLPRAAHLYNKILEARYTQKLAEAGAVDPLGSDRLKMEVASPSSSSTSSSSSS